MERMECTVQNLVGMSTGIETIPKFNLKTIKLKQKKTNKSFYSLFPSCVARQDWIKIGDALAMQVTYLFNK